MASLSEVRAAFGSRGLAAISTVAAGLMLPGLVGNLAGPEAFATFMVANVVVGFSSALSRFGLGHYALTVRDSAEPNNEEVGELWSLRRLVALVGGVTSIAGMYVTQLSLTPTEVALVGLLGATEAVRLFVSELFLAERNWRRSLLTSYAIRPALTAFALVPLLLLGAQANLGVLLAITASIGAATYALATRARRSPTTFRPRYRLLGRGGSFFAFQVASLAIARGEIWIAAIVLLPDTSALFVAASTLAYQVGIVSRVASEGLSPFIGDLAVTKDRKYTESLVRRATLLAGIASVFGAGALLLIPEHILSSYFGFDWNTESPVLLILLAATVTAAVLGPGPMILTLVGHHREAAVGQVVSAAVLIAGGLWLGENPVMLAMVALTVKVGLGLWAAAELYSYDKLVILPGWGVLTGGRSESHHD